MVKNSSLSEDVKEGFSQRRLEFLEDFSASIVKITKAHEAHNKLYKPKVGVLSTVGRKRSQEDGLVSVLFVCLFVDLLFLPKASYTGPYLLLGAGGSGDMSLGTRLGNL